MKIKILMILVCLIGLGASFGDRNTASAATCPGDAIVYYQYLESANTEPNTFELETEIMTKHRTDPRAYAEAVVKFGFWQDAVTLIPPAHILRVDVYDTCQ